LWTERAFPGLENGVYILGPSPGAELTLGDAPAVLPEILPDAAYRGFDVTGRPFGEKMLAVYLPPEGELSPELLEVLHTHAEDL